MLTFRALSFLQLDRKQKPLTEEFMVIKQIIIVTKHSPIEVTRVIRKMITRFSLFPVTDFRHITVLPGRQGN